MRITVNKSQFVSEFLNPVSKLSDNLSLRLIKKEQQTTIKTLATSADNSVILMCNIPCESKEEFNAIIPECKTFLRLFSGIDQEKVGLSFDSNSIVYKDNTFSFKYHLLDESYIINKKSISEEKLNKIEFDTKFVISKSKLSDIVRFNSIVPDAEKLYFYTEGKSVYAKLGDEQKSNTNEVKLEVSNQFDGSTLIENLPINIQNILLFSFSSENVCVSVNQQLKIFVFETDT